MKPVHVGYTNPTLTPDAYAPELRKDIFLTDKDWITHLHGIGATRSGKSKWLEWLCRQLMRERVGFTLIDPQGALAESLVQYLAYKLPNQKIIYFNPSRTDYLVPFNPFRPVPGDEVAVRAGRQAEATLRAWGLENADTTPRLDRMLRSVYHLFATGQVNLNEIYGFFFHHNHDLHEHAVELLADFPDMQQEWRSLAKLNKREFETQIESTRSRFSRFISARNVVRIMSLQEPGIDFGTLFENGHILIANLQDSEYFTEQNARLVGSLMINELWSEVRRRTFTPSKPYFLLIDEFQKFLTPDIREILDRGAGKGLHLGIFHQHLSQLEEQDPWTYESVMANAKTKVVFGGLTRRNAMLIADEIFAGQINLNEVKFLIEQTKFWPTYQRDQVNSKSAGGSSGSTSGVNTSSGSGMSASMGYNPITQEWNDAFGGSTEFSGQGTFTAESSSESWAEGVSDIPIFYPVPFKETSSITPYSLEEQRQRLAEQLMLLLQRHYFIRRPGKKTIPAVTPFVKSYRVFPTTQERYVVEQLLEPNGLSIREIDNLLDALKERLPDDSSVSPHERENW